MLARACHAKAAGLWAFGIRTPSLGRRSARVHWREAESAQSRTKESGPRRAAESGHEPLWPVAKSGSRCLERRTAWSQRWAADEGQNL